MTKQDFMFNHPDVNLVMAPITGGADICLSDYMDSMCSSLSTDKIDDAAVFAFSNSVVLTKKSQNEMTLRILYGGLAKSDRKYLMSELFEVHDVMDMAYDCGDGSELFFIMDGGNVFMPDYYESYAQLHNDGYIRCIHINDASYIGQNLRDIQRYLENYNDDPECQTVCTTEQVGNDVKFEFWYKE